MKQILKRMWQRLTCKHEYKHEKSLMLHGGMRKMVIHKCVKCGKEKTYIV